jgi:multidrug efflux pump subunit AcrA (membrane-fusion protein)
MKLALDNEKGILRAGMFTNVKLIRDKKDKAIIIPMYSVITEGKKTYCCIVENKKAKRQEVEVGVIKDFSIEILKGLKAGTQVITRGHRQVTDNQSVNVIASK